MEGGRSYYQEDPRRWNNFTLGLHAEISAREKIKNAIWVLLPSLLA